MTKNAIRICTVLAVCLSAPAVSFAESITYVIRDDGKSGATFVSDAPLETMTGKTSKVTGKLMIDPADITQTKGSFEVPVASLRTGNDLRDEHLQGDGWLDAKKYPHIEFEITEVVLGKKDAKELKKNKETKVQVKGKFTAHGITKIVTTKGTVKWSDDTVRIKASFVANLEDHQISVPSIVRLKVANEMDVSVDLTAVPE
ncbi:MAG TPA: YceI family protein [Polyangiales bacterium]|nr:YceI family protein [Polyangiales bacterium]